MAKARKKVDHPWLATAILCDQTLMDTSGVYSAIRIIDQWNLVKPTSWNGKTYLYIPLITLISFKSGDVKGKRVLRIYHTSPKDKRKKMFERDIEFLGGQLGVNVRIEIQFGFKTAGTHWFDVYVGKWHATRMPLTIVFQKEAQDARKESSSEKG